MKTQDLIRATKNTKIYLDMDGVLADFFHEYAKLAGVPENEGGTHDYRLIPLDLREPVIDQMRGTDIFYRLPKFSTADQLVQLVLDYVPFYNICSSPLRGDHANSEHWKKEWIKKHLTPQPKDIVITGMKQRWAKNTDGSANILIDDRRLNIEAWEERGGIGIKYQASEDSLDTVVRGLKAAYGY